MIYKQFLAYSSNGCSRAPFTDYRHNKIFQGLPIKRDCFDSYDGKVYFDMRGSIKYTGELDILRRDDSNLVLRLYLKDATTKKMGLQVFGQSQGKCLYIPTDKGLTMKYKTYSTAEKKTFLVKYSIMNNYEQCTLKGEEDLG